MTDPTPNGQTWVCGWTDVGANCLAGDPCDPETCGYRPVPPAPSSDERAPFADLTDEEFALFAEGAGFDPAPRSDTPSDERHAWKRSGPWDHTVGPDRCICGKGWPCPDAPARPAPSTPVPEASGRPGEMVFTQGSPRPALQVLVSLTDGRPCVDAVSMLAFFRDSAAWNEVAGDPEKVAGLRAAADAMWELHGKAKAHLHDPAPSSSPVPEASGQSRDGQNQRLRALAVEAVIQEWLAEDISPCRYGAVEYDAECPWHMGEVDWPELARNIAAKLDASPAPSSSPVGDRVPSVHLLLDIWQALGGDSEAFHPWWAADPSFPDRWAQIVAAVAGDISGLAADSNPPAGALLDIAIQFGAADRGEPTP